MPAAPAVMLTDQEGVEQVMSRAGVSLRLNVSKTGVVSAAEAGTLTHCLNYASALVNNWCGKRVAAGEMAGDYMFYSWASVVAAYRLCLYRLGAVPASLLAEYQEVMQHLREVAVGAFQPAGVRSLCGAGAVLVNVRLDGRFRTKQVREELSISDGHATVAGPRRVDIVGQYVDPLQPDR